ncbi:hypothetical protein SDC9_185755 [bioreactor metagenome]|uniref:Uncharacterized protein n=1 Tax=bioreactor metagenome TaxID=1076179 RepID=A0A645HGT3_9ZZZZ
MESAHPAVAVTSQVVGNDHPAGADVRHHRRHAGHAGAHALHPAASGRLVDRSHKHAATKDIGAAQLPGVGHTGHGGQRGVGIGGLEVAPVLEAESISIAAHDIKKGPQGLKVVLRSRRVRDGVLMQRVLGLTVGDALARCRVGLAVDKARPTLRVPTDARRK